jgi:uncharacterized short protein YbdD (DUF466 family)
MPIKSLKVMNEQFHLIKNCKDYDDWIEVWYKSEPGTYLYCEMEFDDEILKFKTLVDHDVKPELWKPELIH